MSTVSLQVPQGQPPDANSGRLENHEAPFVERLLELDKVGEDDRYLAARMPLESTAEQDHRGFLGATKGEDRSKVGIRRDENTILLSRTVKNDVVRGSLKAEIAHVNGIVPRSLQVCRDGW